MLSAQVFRGRTAAEARRVAVQRLGPQAVILTTRSVPRPGFGGLLGASDVEVAAIPEEPAAASEPRLSPEAVPFAKGVYGHEQRTFAHDIAALRAELKGDIRALKTLVTQSDQLSNVAAEIAQLRELVEALREPRSPRSDKIAAQVQALGFEGAGAAALCRKLRKAGGVSSLRQEVVSMLHASAWPLDGKNKTTVALVGPTGVGKTTTAAKLAAQARIAGRTVTLVACDTYRVGGVTQLAQYAELMGVECLVPRDADELRAIGTSCESDVLIVDTSGRPPTAEGIETALSPDRKAVKTPARARHVLLCLPAAVRASDAARIVRRFAPVAPTALAITKIDETDAPAGILHSIWASKLPISVVCNGQRVPEDIAPASIESLANHLISSPAGSTAPA